MRLWLVCKPSSVIEGNHQSRCNIAVTFKRSREQASSLYVPHLAPHGVYSELLSPIFRVSSYLTFSPLPPKWLYISVALFLKLPWLDVIKRDCSVVLGLSSHKIARNCPTNCKYYIIIFLSSQLLYFTIKVMQIK